MLRTPKQEDDFETFEKQVSYFKDNDEDRRKIQLIFSEIGNNSRYSIYDYMDYLKNAGRFTRFVDSNSKIIIGKRNTQDPSEPVDLIVELCGWKSETQIL